MNKAVTYSVIFIMGVWFIAGCARKDNLDKQAVEDLVKSSEWFDAEAPEDSTRENPGTMLMAAADSVVWWRANLIPETPDLFIDVVDDSAYVEWERHHTGHMNIFAFEPDTGWMHWDKPYGEYAAVKGTFRRKGQVSDSARGWELETISCAAGYSDGGSITIDSVHLVGAESGTDEFLTPPYTNHFYGLDSLPAFTSLEDVTITLYTSSEEETVAYLHTLVGPWPARDTFSDLGDGVFEGTWAAQWVPATRFVIFDVMTKATLWEQDGQYDYTGVLFPYQTVSR